MIVKKGKEGKEGRKKKKSTPHSLLSGRTHRQPRQILVKGTQRCPRVSLQLPTARNLLHSTAGEGRQQIREEIWFESRQFSNHLLAVVHCSAHEDQRCSTVPEDGSASRQLRQLLLMQCCHPAGDRSGTSGKPAFVWLKQRKKTFFS